MKRINASYETGNGRQSVGGDYLPKTGGTITGDLTVNGAIHGTSDFAIKAQTQDTKDNSQKIATTEYVSQKIGISSTSTSESVVVPNGGWTCGKNYATAQEDGTYIVESWGQGNYSGTTRRILSSVVNPATETTGGVNQTWVGGTYSGYCDLHSITVTSLSNGDKVYPSLYMSGGTSGSSITFSNVRCKITRLR